MPVVTINNQSFEIDNNMLIRHAVEEGNTRVLCAHYAAYECVGCPLPQRCIGVNPMQELQKLNNQ